MLSIPNVKFFTGSRGPHGPDLPSPFERKFQIPSFVFINEENKSKEIQGKNVYSFTKFVLGDFVWGVFGLRGFCWGVYVWGILS